MGVNASAPAPTGPGSQLDGARVRVAVKERYYAFLPKYINRHAALSEEKVRLAAHHWNYIADEVNKACFFLFPPGTASENAANLSCMLWTRARTCRWPLLCLRPMVADHPNSGFVRVGAQNGR